MANKKKEQSKDESESSKISTSNTTSIDKTKKKITTKKKSSFSRGFKKVMKNVSPPKKNKTLTHESFEPVSGNRVSNLLKMDSFRTNGSVNEEMSRLACEFPVSDPKDTALHVACAKNYTTYLIVQLLNSKPKLAAEVNAAGELAIHLAMRNKCTDVALVEKLIECNPDAATTGNNDNSFPIHAACEVGVPSEDAVKVLIDRFPSTLLAQNDLILPYDGPIMEPVTEVDSEKSAGNKNNDERSSGLDSVLTFLGLRVVDIEENAEAHVEPHMLPKIIPEERSWSPLHLAVLTGAPSEVIEHMMQVDDKCIELKTSQGRTALECGKYVLKQNEVEGVTAHTLLTDETTQDKLKNMPEPVQNTLASVTAIESHIKSRLKVSTLLSTVDLATNALQEIQIRKSGSVLWKKLKTAVTIMGAFDFKENSLLGKKVDRDKDDAVCPEGFSVPPNLDHLGLEVDLPVGFLRLRWAMLHNDSKFVEDALCKEALNYTEYKEDEWCNHKDKIGSPNSPKDVNEKEFIGTTKTCEYLFPKSGFVGANMAFETVNLIEYNDYCFALKKITKNPDVPFGKTFVALTQIVIVNQGNDSCKMMCSVEPEYVGKKPMIHRQIKNGMQGGTLDIFVQMGKVICQHAN